MDSDLRSSSSPRKVRFAPKGPPRRGVKPPPQAKSETVKEADADEDEKRALLQAVTKHLTRGQTKAEKKPPKQVAFSHGVASSPSIGTYGGLQDNNDKGLKGSTSDDDDHDQDLLSLPSATNTADEIDEDLLLKKKKREYKEPWDYDHSYYPTSLPWRKPFSGDPELLDEDEFGEAASAREYDESTVNAASDLGLQEKVDDAKMFVFQLPANIPFGEQPTSTDRMGTAGSLKFPRSGSDSPAIAKGKEVPLHTSMVSAGDRSTSSSVRGNAHKKVCSLEELPAGCLGKLLVYKSGVVKLKMGDILFDVSPGIGSSFAQEIMTVNTKEKQCCSLGEPNNKWAIVTPDIESLLESQ